MTEEMKDSAPEVESKEISPLTKVKRIGRRS